MTSRIRPENVSNMNIRYSTHGRDPGAKVQELPRLNQRMTNTFFCGSYFRYGFHEDAFSSAVDLCSASCEPGVWSMNSCLYECSAMHHRLAPKEHHFQP